MWATVASLAGVLVAAGGAAWAIAREQSLLRQLERITDILKDTEAAGSARADLEHVRDSLARRINLRYRAPRLRQEAFGSWYLILAGCGAWLIFVGNGFVWATERVLQAHLPGWVGVTSTGIVAIILAGLGAFWYAMRIRERERWVHEAAQAGDDSRSEAPML